jgi:hypothetical protein
MSRVEQLLDDKRNNEIAKIKKKLELLNNIAIRYYEQARHDAEVLHPNLWLNGQDDMRALWENVKNRGIIDSTFSRYMNFMYDNYPKDFTKTIKYNIDEIGYCDGAEVYYELTKCQ